MKKYFLLLTGMFFISIAYTQSRVKICNQIWTTKNLNVATYRNGDPIQQVTDRDEWEVTTTGAWCWYNNDSATYGAAYGRLYNWYAVTDPRGLAPAGWHVPSDKEWVILANCIGGEKIAGFKMKETGTAHWRKPNIGATNKSGFTGLAGGTRDHWGWFHLFAWYGYWWTTTESEFNDKNAVFRYLSYDVGNLYMLHNRKNDGFSVRCIKD